MPEKQEIFSRDGSLKAIITPRADGKQQVEFYMLHREDTPESGPNLTWDKIPGLSVLETLADAIELASRHVGAGSEDYFGEGDE